MKTASFGKKPITRRLIRGLRGSLKDTKALEVFRKERSREREL
jgi:hypothetical protein